MKQYDLDKIRGFIKRCKWGWATSMIDVPHEYIVRQRCELTDEEFLYFVHAQRDLGIHESWGKYNFPYLYVDGYKYWTMGDTFENTIILNRQKVFNEFNFLDWPLKKDYSAEEEESAVKSILNTFDGRSFFECGFGNGGFVKLSGVKPENYYGVEPCKKAISLFRGIAGFYRKCSTISFEEAINKWLSSGSVVIATFGSPSYFMPQYLKKLNQSELDYFLMFYNEGYTPEGLEEMHHFNYKLSELKKIFPRAFVYVGKNYVTLCSKEVKWERVRPKQYELFSV